MGSWNGTCMISNLPIISGEKVKAILLYAPYSGGSALNMSGFVYSTGIMTPAFYPLEGEYDDYGGVENLVEDWNYKIVNDTLRKRYKSIEVEKKRLDDFSIENIFEGIERNSLKTLNPLNDDIYETAKKVMEMDHYKDDPSWKNLAEVDTSEKWRNSDLSFVMIRKDVWDYICENYKGEFWKDDEDRTSVNDYYQTAKEHCIKEFNKSFNIKLSDDPKTALMQRMARRDLSIFNRVGESGHLMSTEEYNDYAYSDAVDKELLFKAYFEFTSVSTFISITRKSWVPQAGAGSQSQEWKEYKILTEIINKVCDEHLEEEERWRKEDEEEEEDEEQPENTEVHNLVLTETQLTHYSTIGNFEDLVEKVYGQSIEIHADQELGNDDDIVTDTKKEELDEWEVDELNEFIRVGHYSFLFYVLLKDLTNKGYIQEGNYVFKSY